MSVSCALDFSFIFKFSDNDAIVFRELIIDYLMNEKTRAGFKRSLLPRHLELLDSIVEQIKDQENASNFIIKQNKENKPSINISVYNSDQIETTTSTETISKNKK